jgi:hypothetical protein
MSNSARISSARSILRKAASSPIASAYPAWIDASEYGVIPSTVIPRVRDNLGLRLVAGRRQQRDKALLDANGMP